MSLRSSPSLISCNKYCNPLIQASGLRVQFRMQRFCDRATASPEPKHEFRVHESSSITQDKGRLQPARDSSANLAARVLIPIGFIEVPVWDHLFGSLHTADGQKSCMTLRTLNYGNYGIFLIMGNAGFCPSAVWTTKKALQWSLEVTRGKAPIQTPKPKPGTNTLASNPQAPCTHTREYILC